MKGWKTLMAGVGLICTGLGLIAKEIVEGTWNLQTGVTTLLSGLAVIGLGHKLDKGPS